MRIAVCDDDVFMLNQVAEIMLSLCSEEENATVDRFTDSLNLLQAHQKQPYEILFSDIQMPQMDGFDLSQELAKISQNIIVVYITNHDHLVFSSLKFHPTYFVRKEKLKEDMKYAFDEVKKEYRARFGKVCFDQRVGKGRGAVCLPLEQIRYVMSEVRKVYVVTETEQYLTCEGLSCWKEKLEGLGFAQCHSRYLVNISKVLGLAGDSIILEGDERIPLSRRRMQEIKAQIVERGVIQI